MRLIATTVALAVFCSGVANAEEFMCKIVKVDGNKVTLNKGKKDGPKVPDVTLEAWSAVKVYMTKDFKKPRDRQGFIAGGLKAKIFTEINAEEGIIALVIFQPVSGLNGNTDQITEIRVVDDGRKAVSENRAAQKDDRVDKAKRVAEIEKEIIELQARIGKLSAERAQLQPDLEKNAEEKKAEEKDEATKICEFLLKVPAPEKKAQEDVLDKLEKIRPDLHPHVVAMWFDKEAGPVVDAIRNLAKLGKKARPAMPIVLFLLSDEDGLVQQAALQAIVALVKDEPEHIKQVLPCLVTTLNDKKTTLYLKTQVIDSLAKFGPHAKDAIPALRALRFDENAEIRMAVQSALKKIEGAK